MRSKPLADFRQSNHRILTSFAWAIQFPGAKALLIFILMPDGRLTLLSVIVTPFL